MIESGSTFAVESTRFREGRVAVEHVDVAAFTVPTDLPESDGTLEWRSSTIVIVHVRAQDVAGVGYTYSHECVATLIHATLADIVIGMDAMSPVAAWNAMQRATRNFGRPGIVASAIAAVDSALWDLKARLLYLPLVSLLGSVRASVPVYGSGGFTSYTMEQLGAQFARWVEADGIRAVKMKVGSDFMRDIERVRVARDAVGPDVSPFSQRGTPSLGADGPRCRRPGCRLLRHGRIVWL